MRLALQGGRIPLPRAICSSTITFGLVSIPVKFYTAAQAERVSFNLLSPEGNRVYQKLVDSMSGKEIVGGQGACDKASGRRLTTEGSLGDIGTASNQVGAHAQV